MNFLILLQRLERRCRVGGVFFSFFNFHDIYSQIIFTQGVLNFYMKSVCSYISNYFSCFLKCQRFDWPLFQPSSVDFVSSIIKICSKRLTLLISPEQASNFFDVDAKENLLLRLFIVIRAIW